MTPEMRGWETGSPVSKYEVKIQSDKVETLKSVVNAFNGCKLGMQLTIGQQCTMKMSPNIVETSCNINVSPTCDSGFFDPIKGPFRRTLRTVNLIYDIFPNIILLGKSIRYIAKATHSGVNTEGIFYRCYLREKSGYPAQIMRIYLAEIEAATQEKATA